MISSEKKCTHIDSNVMSRENEKSMPSPIKWVTEKAETFVEHAKKQRCKEKDLIHAKIYRHEQRKVRKHHLNIEYKLKIPVTIRTWKKKLKVNALLDSKGYESFIDIDYVKNNNIPMIPLGYSSPTVNADGTIGKMAATHKISILMDYSSSYPAH